MPTEMPATGYVIDYLLFVFVAGSLCVIARMARARSKPLSIALWIAGALAVVALLGETWFRYVVDEPDVRIATMSGRAWRLRHWDPHLNAHGFRDHAWPDDKREGVRRIAVIGDELVGGLGIERLADRVGDRVLAGLDAIQPGATEIWNVGYPHWTTAEQTSWLQDSVRGARIDVVVLLYSLDDMEDLLPRERLDELDLALTTSRSTWINHHRSFLYDTWWYRHHSPSDVGLDDESARAHLDDQLWAQQSERLSRLVGICRERDVPVAIAVVPRLLHWGPQYPYAAEHGRIVDLARGLGAHAIDLAGDFRGLEADDLIVSRHAPHPNERAHEILGDAVGRWLRTGR